MSIVKIWTNSLKITQQIGEVMKKVALIGHPVSHSLSPKLHNYWIEKYGIDAIYEAVDVLPNELENTIKRMQKEGYIGCNITMPYKEEVLKYVKQLKFTGGVSLSKSCNLISFNRANYIGGCNVYNMDIHAIEQAFGGFTKLLDKEVLILGFGGVAKSVIEAFKYNEGRLLIATRDTFKTNVKLRYIKNSFAIFIESLEKNLNKGYDYKDYLPDIDLLINATPCGMDGYPELDIDLSTLNKNAVVFDAVYNPIKTGLIKQAEALGIKTISGFEMFLYQAQASFEIWFGIKPEITQELRDLMMEELR